MWSKVKAAWNWFEAQVAKVAPGLKTYLTLFLAFVGNTAYVAKDYITSLPLDKFITGSQVAIATMVLALLAVWFHNMTDRNADDTTPVTAS